MNYIKKIFSPGCLTISIFLILYTFYKSEIIWNGEKRDYYLIYYIISIILIFFSILTFYLNQKIKYYLIISFVSIISFLYLVEFYFSFRSYLSSKELLLEETFSEKRTNEKYDKRTKLEIYNDLKKINNKISMVIYPRSHLKDKNKILPLSGISNSKTLFCNENGYYSIYKSDRYGFNNPDKEWDQNEIEYVLVGDSYTHGACVNRPNDIASVLRTLSNKSALNLGYYYNSPLIEYATLREYLTSNVKKVVWIYFSNDIIDLNDELNNKILKNYLNNNDFTQNLKSKQNEIDDLVFAKLQIKKKEREKALNSVRERQNKPSLLFIKFVKIYELRNLLFSSSRSEKKLLQEFRKILKSTKDLTSKKNSQLFFVYLPGYLHYKNNNNSNYLSVKKIVNELDIPFIDLYTEAFGKEQNLKKFFTSEGEHYNEEGYKRAAETIYKFTKSWKSN